MTPQFAISIPWADRTAAMTPPEREQFFIARDAGEAGFRVGYEDQSHFSCDYKRQFGEPPMRDVERMRELATV